MAYSNVDEKQRYTNNVNTGVQRIAASKMVRGARHMETVITAERMLAYLLSSFPNDSYNLGQVCLYMRKMTFFGWLIPTQYPRRFLVTTLGKDFGSLAYAYAMKASPGDRLHYLIPRPEKPAVDSKSSVRVHPAINLG